MKEFYVGKLVNVNKIIPVKYQLDIVQEDVGKHNLEIYKYIKEIVNGNYDQGKKDYLAIMLGYMIMPNIKSIDEIPVVYRKIRDRDGNEYGVEIVTGYIFPINNRTFYNNKYSVGNCNEVFFDIESGNIFAVLDTSIEYYCMMGDTCKKEVAMPLELAKAIDYTTRKEDKTITLGGKKYELIYSLPDSFEITIKPELSFSDDKVVNYAIANETEANELDVQKYINELKGLKNIRRKIHYQNLLQQFTLCNKIGYLNSVNEQKSGIKYIKKIQR